MAVDIDPRLEARRMAVAEQRARGRLRRLLTIIIVLAIAGAIAWTLRSPFFSVEHLVVEGSESPAVADILSEAGVGLGTPLANPPTGYTDYGSLGQYTITATVPQAPAVISGTLFEDWDGDGVRDPNDPGLVARTVFVDGNNNGTLDSGEQRTTTGDDGRFALPVTPGGESGLIVRAPSFAESRRTIPAGAATAEVQVTLQPATLSETVTVTASRVEQRLRDVPAAGQRPESAPVFLPRLGEGSVVDPPLDRSAARKTP